MVDPQVLLESTNQLKSSTAARDAAKATIKKAEAELLSRQAALAKAEVDVKVAEADLAVAESEAKRLEAWVGYLTLTAPFDGVIVARNANTFDFVLPATGDPTAMERVTPPLARRRRRADLRGRPHRHRPHLRRHPRAGRQLRPHRDQGDRAGQGIPRPADPGSVTRTSWALNVKSRTLRAEIDLPNPGSQLLPGMYAYAKVIIERPGVRALPLAALTYSGEKTYCWTHENGQAVRTEIQTGVSDGEWIEVTNRQRPAGRPTGEEPWVPIDGTEQVILGDLSLLADGEPVEVAPAAGAGRNWRATRPVDLRQHQAGSWPIERMPFRGGSRRGGVERGLLGEGETL